MFNRHSVGWADGSTWPDCRSTHYTVAHLFSCPTHLAPGYMWTAPLQVAQFLAGLYSLATCPHCRSILTPFLHNLHCRCWPSSPWPPTGHHHHLTLHFYLISLVVRGSSAPSANQQLHRKSIGRYARSSKLDNYAWSSDFFKKIWWTV